MTKIVLFFITGIHFLLIALCGTAQTGTEALTLENIYSGKFFSQRGFGPLLWMKDNKGYSLLETNKESGSQEIIRYEAESGNRTNLVSAQQLIPEGSNTSLPVNDYKWSDDNSKLLIFTNTKKVWRYNTRGDYWVLNMQNGQLKQLGKSLEPSTLMFAKFSPDGTKVAYVSRQNIYIEDLVSDNINRITIDGGENIINGTFDWVYEEELGCLDGFRWSPDGESIAYWQSDTRNIGTFYLINNIDSLYSIPIPFPYPKVGTKLSAVKIGVVSAKGGKTSWFDIPGGASDNYLARMEFIPHSNEVMIQQLNRLQNSNKIWVGNISTMAFKNIMEETDKSFLELHDNTIWLNNEKYFTWTSERDGWMHLYRIARNGEEVKLITKGEFDIVDVKCIDEKGGYVYYIASPRNFTERYLYRSRLDGKGQPERITPEGLNGQHDYQMSSNAQWAIHKFQNSITPARISLLNLRNHKEVKVLEDNSELKEKYDRLKLLPKQFFKINIGDEILDAYMIKPADFDPSKKYPLLFYVYGEPAGSTVQNNWDGGEGLWHQYMAQQQYIVISVDNRGTKTPRGSKWRRSVYGQIGILASSDQSRAAHKIFEMFDFIDSSRVGIWGWSGGGQMTLNCIFRYPEIYKAGLAVSFVSDQRLYDATYQERYMGLITENTSGYHDGSPINFVSNLKGKLMIIHGTGDDNVHYQSFEMLTNELIRNNKLFSMMSYPMRTHSISERENTTLHLRRTMEKFWKENL